MERGQKSGEENKERQEDERMNGEKVIANARKECHREAM